MSARCARGDGSGRTACSLSGSSPRASSAAAISRRPRRRTSASCVARQRVVVDDAVDRLVLLGERDVVPDRAQVVAEMDDPGRLDAGEDPGRRARGRSEWRSWGASVPAGRSSMSRRECSPRDALHGPAATRRSVRPRRRGATVAATVAAGRRWPRPDEGIDGRSDRTGSPDAAPAQERASRRPPSPAGLRILVEGAHLGHRRCSCDRDRASPIACRS